VSGHFGTLGTEGTGHFGTSSDMSHGQFGTGAEVSRVRSVCAPYDIHGQQELQTFCT